MTAVQVDAFGGVECLRIVESAKPVPCGSEVLIRVAASGLNYSDLMQREGIYPGGPTPPYFPGIEAAGVIESVGTDIGQRLLPGARVAFIVPNGAHSEYVAVNAQDCIGLPDEL